MSECNNELIPIFEKLSEIAHRHSLMDEASEVWLETDKQFEAVYNQAVRVFNKYHKDEGGFFMAMYNMRKEGRDDNQP